ncbi:MULTISPECIES: hypothetical protein [Klebsiella/Raoultella group]|uniref:Uncharacterized protein n=1 Tax=Klebsiella grimontii TaxID=2058152 RepID=A0A285B851_9ENTR|nr:MULTISPECIES: hypothetical protein [Klebsiella/Raoultella group]MEB5726183.1 hypothetical protein [Raoultella ornithinolytica]QCK80344.1 hypothetical protein E4K08_29040 [Raoultella ornithinolytica]SNU37171.1 conserved hypothetical protein [Klebsiella grimontii]HEC2567887.1 hypothetical protein [Raoultella ornithinolytica]HEC2631732.1 hypothetical protein [Raoultella ornithinolytica]
MNQKYRPFTSLSRRKRRAKTFEVKNLIYRERYRCGGLFYDDCDMNAAVASGNWRWSDILFLGRDPAVFWNAEIITASEAFNDRVESIAFDEAWSMLDDDERQYDFRYKSAFPQFAGLTWMEYIEKREQEIARENPPVVHCGYRILPGYVSGIGLQIIVDVDLLNRDVIESTIADFIARDEKNGPRID